MTINDLLTSVRSSNLRLWESHLRFIESNGQEGMRCFSPEKMQELINRTDDEIIMAAIARGVYLEDLDNYYDLKQ